MERKEFEHNHEVESATNFGVLMIPNIPEIKVDDNLAEIIYDRSRSIGGLFDKDILVVASKIVSKSEGRVVNISKINPSQEAIELAGLSGKTPEACQIILEESSKFEMHGHSIIAKHKLGFVLTSAGVDKMDDTQVSLIPEDPDKSAKKLREELEKLSGQEISVIICDSEGREDRVGAGAVALGVSGIDPIRRSISPLGKVQEETISDMLSNAASILIGQRGKNTPVVIIRGLSLERNINLGMLDYLHK